MSGNFRCDACKGMFMSLAPVGHGWLCSGCVSKAAGEREVEYGPSGHGSGDTLRPEARDTSPDSPVAAETSEYGWPKKGETFIVAAYGLCAAAHDFAPGQASRGYDMPPDGVTWAMWDGACRRGYNDPYRRINSPTAGPRDSAEQAEPDPRAFGRPSDASGVGSSGVGQGEMSDEAIYARWQEAAAARSGLSPAAFIAYVVRSEVARAKPPKLTAVDIAAALVEVYGGTLSLHMRDDEHPDNFYRLARIIERRLRGES